MFEQTFKNIDDILHKDAGCTSELDYTGQSSWLLFLKYLDALEQDKAAEAALEGKTYSFILAQVFRWDSWAAPKTADGKIDHNAAMTGDKQKYFIGSIPGAYVLSEGSLLVAMTEQAAGLLGSPLLVPEPDCFLHNQRLGLVTGKPGVAWVNDFFFHVFNLARVRSEIQSSASGSKVRHTSPSKIGAVRVCFPSTATEQRQVGSKLAEVFEACEQLAGVYQRKLAALDELKRALLHQAFSGGL